MSDLWTNVIATVVGGALTTAATWLCGWLWASYRKIVTISDTLARIEKTLETLNRLHLELEQRLEHQEQRLEKLELASQQARHDIREHGARINRLHKAMRHEHADDEAEPTG